MGIFVYFIASNVININLLVIKKILEYFHQNNIQKGFSV